MTQCFGNSRLPFFPFTQIFKKKFISFGIFLFCTPFTNSYAMTANTDTDVVLETQQEEKKEETGSSVLKKQRYTGSLLSPSGALVDAGTLVVQTYLQNTISRGAYQANGKTKNSKNRTDNSLNFTLIKYAITNHLSVQALPQIRYMWNGHTTASSIHFADLPFELQYRWINQKDHLYQPSLSTIVGMIFPTGNYNNLGRRLDGVGTGNYTLRFGLQSQAAYVLFNRALRVRVWGMGREPLNSVNLRNISSYGTSTGFQGNAKSKLFGNTGFSLEYGLNKKWLLSFDCVYDWAKGTRIKGFYHTKPNSYYRNVNGASHDIQIAPAIEFNPSPRIGIIVGAALTVDGHNTNNFVQPQMAVDFVF